MGQCGSVRKPESDEKAPVKVASAQKDGATGSAQEPGKKGPSEALTKLMAEFVNGVVALLNEEGRKVLPEVTQRLQNGEDKDVVYAEIQQRMKKITAERTADFVRDHEYLLHEIWDDYDVNRDGQLSREECVVLCRDLLAVGKRHALMLVQKSEAFKSEEQRAAAQKKVEDSYERTVERAEEMAKMLLKDLDVNSDGKVERHEFVSHFLRAYAHVNREFSQQS